MTPVDLVGIGTNSIDHVVMLPAPLADIAASGKARMLARRAMAGGQTATTACACARLGLRARYAGVFGSDDEGRRIRETLQAHDIDIADAIEYDGPNRHAVILVDPEGCRTVLWHRAEHAAFPSARVHQAISGARIVHVDDDDPALALAAAQAAAAARIPVTSDLEHVDEAIERLIAAVTHPIFDHNAPRAITGSSDPETALRKLRRITASVLCMTLGDAGCVALDGDRLHVAPAFRVTVVDNTGAGDVFRAGYIYGLLQGWDVPHRLRFANAAAAISCTRLGAIPSVPSLREVEELLEKKRN